MLGYMFYIIPVSVIIFMLLIEFNKNKLAFAALILFAAVFTVMSVNLSIVSSGSSGRLTVSPVYIQSDDSKIEGTIQLAEVSGRAYAGPLKIYENGRINYYSMEFDEQGRLIGDEHSLKYKKEIHQTLKYFNLYGKVTGSSVSYESIEKLQAAEAAEKKHSTEHFSPKVFLMWIALLAAVVAAHLAIYYYMVIIRKKKSISSMRLADL